MLVVVERCGCYLVHFACSPTSTNYIYTTKLMIQNSHAKVAVVDFKCEAMRSLGDCALCEFPTHTISKQICHYSFQNTKAIKY